MVLTHGTQLGVDGCTMLIAILVHILPGPRVLWLDNLPLFPAPSRKDQDITSQSAKFKLVTSYKNPSN
jgi:hypothetical protein